MSSWKLAAHSPWPKFSVAFLLIVAFYVLARDAFPYSGKYHDLLATLPSDRDALMAHPGTSRLVKTLYANERRYQYTIGEREKLIAKTGGRHIPAYESCFVPCDLLKHPQIPASAHAVLRPLGLLYPRVHLPVPDVPRRHACGRRYLLCFFCSSLTAI
jgi:hypothetical protein